MAQDSELSKTSDKGKGKAVDDDRKPDDAQKDSAANPAANGKKDDGKDECLFPRAPPCAGRITDPRLASEELSEEDQQLKSELDMLVERLTVCNQAEPARGSR